LIGISHGALAPAKRLAALAVASAALTLGATQAHADVVLHYTGNPFTVTAPPWDTSDFISGSLLVAKPLAANLSDANVTPLSFSFFDGVNTHTDQNAPDSQFLFSTDATGALTGWHIVIDTASGPGAPEIQIFNSNGSVADEAFITFLGSATQFATVGNDPGIWVERTVPKDLGPNVGVPEPASWALMILGFGGMGVVLRRRRAAVGAA
jgi:hypothetical protein